MADPITLGTASLVAGLAGGGMSAIGTYGSYQAKADNAAYQSQVARNNAVTARMNADLERQSGEIAVVNKGMQTRAVVGRTKAEQAASGVDINKGSGVEVRAGEAELGLLDALTIRSNAAKRAYSFETQGTSFDASAQLLKRESEQASDAAPWAVGGSLLSSASSVGGNWAKLNSRV